MQRKRWKRRKQGEKRGKMVDDKLKFRGNIQKITSKELEENNDLKQIKMYGRQTIGNSIAEITP